MYYFAYGQDMDLSCMQKLCGSGIVSVGPALLDNYELVFDQRGNPNVVYALCAKVHGVLYRYYSGGQTLTRLDGNKNCPLEYSRQMVRVHRYKVDTAGFVLESKLTASWYHFESPEQLSGKPSRSHLQSMINGAITNGLADAWVDQLKHKLLFAQDVVPDQEVVHK